jgi:thioredoxin-like negative regulator of GroEL
MISDRREEPTGTTILVFGVPECRAAVVAKARLDEALERHARAIHIREVNVWEEPELAVEYSVLMLPTAVATVDGTETCRFGGVPGRRSIARLLAALPLQPTHIGHGHAFG